MTSRAFPSLRGAIHLALVATLLAAAPVAAEQAVGQIGVNAAIRNSVQMKAATEAQLHPAVMRGPVHIGDSVVSGPNSALQVLLLDRSVLTVGADARMTIDRFVYDPNRSASDVAASIARGSFRFMSGRSLAGAGRSAINTPVASIGVRGTIVEGAVGLDVPQILAGEAGLPAQTGDPANATLVVLRGPGLSSAGFDKPGVVDVTVAGTSVTLARPGAAALVWPGQPPVLFSLSDTASARLTARLGTGASGSGTFGQGIDSVGAASGDVLTLGLPGSTIVTVPQDAPILPKADRIAKG